MTQNQKDRIEDALESGVISKSDLNHLEDVKESEDSDVGLQWVYNSASTVFKQVYGLSFTLNVSIEKTSELLLEYKNAKTIKQ